jgi:hypothetical protein
VTSSFRHRFLHEQANGLARLYSEYQTWLPASGRDELLERTYGAKTLELFQWIDTNPEVQTLLHDFRARELQNEQVPTIKPWDSGPPLTTRDPAEEARLFVQGLDAMRSSWLGALFQVMAEWNGYDRTDQVKAAQLGVTSEALLSSGSEFRKAELENEAYVKMADPGPGPGLYAKGKREAFDDRSFKPLGQDLPGFTTADPREQTESQKPENSEPPVEEPFYIQAWNSVKNLFHVDSSGIDQGPDQAMEQTLPADAGIASGSVPTGLESPDMHIDPNQTQLDVQNMSNDPAQQQQDQALQAQQQQDQALQAQQQQDQALQAQQQQEQELQAQQQQEQQEQAQQQREQQDQALQTQWQQEQALQAQQQQEQALQAQQQQEQELQTQQQTPEEPPISMPEEPPISMPEEPPVSMPGEA